MLHARRTSGLVSLCLFALLLLPLTAHAQLVTAPGAGVSPAVRVIELNGTERSFFAYHPAFTGGVRIALGDVNGDGVLDIVTAPGPGGGPHIRVWSGTDLSEIAAFFAYDPAFAGGVWVAAGDVDADGRADIITGAGTGGGPHVRVWSGADLHEIAGFYAYHPTFAGGVSVAAGDVDNDGHADVITGAGTGGGPHVRVWSGANFSELAGFYAYDPAFAGGVTVAAGDVNGDGFADVITGAGPGGGPHVRVWDLQGFSEIGGFFALDPAFTGGVFVGAIDLTGDGRVEIITGAGPGGLPISSIWNGIDLSLMGSYYAYDPAVRSGVFIASVGKNAALRFTSANSTAFARNAAGTFAVTTTGGTAIPALTVTGTLPTGVTFTDNGDGTATLAGTPTSAGVFALTFNATNGSAPPVTQSFTLTVNEAPAITSAASTSFNIGSVGSSFTITTTGSPAAAISVSGALPSGITFTDNNNGTGTLAGTAASGTGGTYPLVITASNGVGADATQNFTLTIQQGAAITSANTVAFTAGAAGTFTITTTGVPTSTSIVHSGSLPSGVTFTNNGNGTATLAGTPGASTGGSYALTITASNGIGSPAVQTFTLVVNQSPSITSATSATFNVGAAGSFTVTTTGFPAAGISTGSPLPAGVTLTDNGDGTATLAGTPGAGTGGAYPLTISAANGIGSPASQSFTLNVHHAPEITSTNTVTFVAGTPGSFTVTTTGFPVPALTRGGVALPGGVTFTDNGDGTGTLAGTPAAATAGSYAISFTATNVAGPTSQPFTLIVRQVPAITSANSATFTVGTPGTFTVTTTGFPAASIGASGALPAGVTFTDNGDGTATIAGTPDPATGGSYALTVSATNVAGSATPQTFTLTINQQAALTSANATTFVAGTPGTFAITTSGTPAATTIAIGGATLPSGVTFVDNGDGTATLSGTPAAASGGTYALTFTATNGVGSPAVQNFTLTVQQPPTLTSGASTTFTVGVAGSFTVTTTGFPSASISRGGDALPSGVTFVDNNDGTGTLAGTPAAGTAGPYALTFTATNIVSSSPVQNFTLTVACPAITVTPASAALAAGTFGEAYSQAFGATGGSGFTFSVTAGAIPAGMTLASNGVLSGSPSNTGTFNFTVTATDSFACAGSSAYSLLVKPNAVNESLTGGVGNTQYVLAPSPTSSTPAVLATGSVLVNDQGPGPLSAVAGTFPTANLGSVNIGANGAFVYTPAIGFPGPTDTFTYTLTDANGITNTATVTINLSGVVWYVNSAGANGDGRSHLPFNTVTAAQTPSQPGQFIFVHAGAATTPGTISLKPGQTLWGAAAEFSLGSLTIPFEGFPTLTGTVTLNEDTTVQFLRVNGGAGPAIVSTNLASAATINLVQVIGGSSGISLTNLNGILDIFYSDISGVTPGPSLQVSGGSGHLVGRVVINSTVGRSVDIQGKTGGSTVVSERITDTGSGVYLANNTGSTHEFRAGMMLSTGAQPAFTAINSGMLEITQNNVDIVGTIATTTGTALNVSNTTISPLGLSFRSISSDGATNAIVLANTGSDGGLTVTGTGSAGSGGTINASTGAGISLTNTRAINLSFMNIQNGGDDGISGSGVVGLNLNTVNITGNGDAAGEHGIDIAELTGSGGMTNTTVTGSAEHNVRIANTTDTLTAFNVTGSTFGSSNFTTGDDGFRVEQNGTGTMNLSITGSTFVDNKGDHFQVSSEASAAGAINFTFSSNTLMTTATHDDGIGTDDVIGGGITINPSGSTDVTFTMNGNNIQQAFDDAIDLNVGSASTAASMVTGTMSNNTIGTALDLNSGSETGNAITVTSNGAATTVVAVTDNAVRQYGNGHGIFITSKDGSSTLHATVTGNTVSNPGTLAINGIRLDAGATAGDAGTTCAAITGNNVVGSGLLTDDIRLRQQFGTTIQLPGYAGANTDTTAVNAFVAGNNTLVVPPTVSSSHNVVGGGGGFLGGAGCIIP